MGPKWVDILIKGTFRWFLEDAYSKTIFVTMGMEPNLIEEKKCEQRNVVFISSNQLPHWYTYIVGSQKGLAYHRAPNHSSIGGYPLQETRRIEGQNETAFPSQSDPTNQACKLTSLKYPP